MITDMTSNYNQQHISSPNFKTSGYMNTGNGYYPQGTSPSLGHQQVAPVMAVPMMNHPIPMPPQPTFFPSPVPSRPSPYGYSEPDSQTYCNYLYQVGFLQGHFSDITVTIPSIGKKFTLHSLILARSPLLYQRLNSTDTTDLTLDYVPRTSDGFHTIFTHLYRPLSSQDMMYVMTENPEMYLDLIGIADYLQLTLKDQLVNKVLAQGFNSESALKWIPHLQAYDDNHEWKKTLVDQLLLYLTKGLAQQFEAFSTSVKMSGGFIIGKNPAHGYMTSKSIPLRGMTRLAKVYSTLPWSFLKRCLEHPDLPVQDNIQRYFFTTKVLALRSSQENVTIGLRFANHQESMVLISTPRRKLGKWDPSLYPSEDEDSD